MEVNITNDGLYIVTFDGVLYNSCTSDVDCPFQLTCNVDALWSAYKEMCTCPISLGRTEDECQFTSMSGYVLMAISCVFFHFLFVLSTEFDCFDETAGQFKGSGKSSQTIGAL